MVAATEKYQKTVKRTGLASRLLRGLRLGGLGQRCFAGKSADEYSALCCSPALGEAVASTTTAYGTADAATTYTTYNAQGQVATQTDADGNITSYVYDLAGREIQVIPPAITGQSNSGVVTYAYRKQNGDAASLAG